MKIPFTLLTLATIAISGTQAVEFQDPPTIPLFQPVPQVPTPNWTGLESALRNSSAWAHAYSQSEETVKANAAFTLLLTSLTATHNEDDLRFAWLRLRELMGTQSSLTDFSDEQLAFVAEALSDNGFDPEDFGL